MKFDFDQWLGNRLTTIGLMAAATGLIMHTQGFRSVAGLLIGPGRHRGLGERRQSREEELIHQWHTGDRCIITADGNTVDARVILASPNGRSLMLEFDAILLGHVGTMPVLAGEDDVFRSIVTGDEVTLSASGGN
jgi:hypothetical protein